MTGEPAGRAPPLSRTDRKRAVELLRRAKRQSEDVGLATVAQGADAYTPVFEHPDAPTLALQGLADTLDNLGEHRLPYVMRAVLRDFLRAFSLLGRYETVAVVDGAAAPIAWAPAWARQAVAEASAALGEDAYNAARERGHSLTDDALEMFLRSELEQVRSARP